MRIVFMGTPDFSVPILTAIIGQGYEVVAVYSQPPRPAGRRGLEVTKSPVHEKAEEFGIPVFTPKSLKGTEEQDVFASLEADVAIVVAYGLLLPQAILDAPRLGCYNGHASLLPRWRGAAPIQRAIMSGDTETGMMIMKMDAGLDTGPVAMAEKVAITPDMTAGELHDRLSLIGADLMVRALGALERESLTLQPQDEEGVTYAAKIEKAEARIDWSKPAKDVHNTIRGISPFPGAWCEMEINGAVERVKLQRSTLGEGSGAPETVPGTILDDRLTIACGEGAVRLVTLQRSGGKPLPAQEFLRGASVTKVL
ncbi:methionyl-tRNA formyltransferase [Brucella pseudogrignonensis]|uniref:methionyl-tRNA formyltransferase n=1 Tax=Brucella pseudogrignonensis TaxID=419475 RepID=UPI0028B8ACC4|nr:methionyl-tRNA formyltransferase [Brucella pseudogrignonensis]MDT6939266.1 methionyl-tRNA formyltransferase [Brucella pseudogrignonensis]